ncbi:hypothetical protein BVRB_012900 [Beta vulgaris subsp. vulgaris]|uniref:Protein kinase domain-containing protein n=2 Tax=Beta vulgaris subsp. vulgaris TaxID=3555 RepID=A0A0J8B5A5_BETVV|nr:E3 ubiquitin-protein ligase KEG isoform X2 [Beta vulgaris subsp. vulgaris]KMS95048.1 hypothetical protein BVRB_012900 [Beta vulgaris subsp. vulgaris]
MANQLISKQPTPFEFVIYEGDADNMRTVVVTPNETNPWIDPSSLKLRHRIGRGLFGDIWLATHHRSAQDYDEYHEVAIKMLNLMKEDGVKAFLDRFANILPKCRAMKGVCWLHGISVIDGKISIVMKFYEGSVGDKMARSKGGKLLLPDVLRYGINLAQAILEFHSHENLVLNLKPSNFLLDENDQAILGDFGVPYLLLGLPLSNSDMSLTLGSPNYMAPEQWEPEVRGPVSWESDTWGYGCSILEMLTGDQPWCGRSVQQIYRSVVINQEKPQIPGGLPPEIENVLSGCFEFDFRNRPLMTDILQAFKSSQDAIMNDETAFTMRGKTNSGRPNQHCYSEWFLSKDSLQEGDTVRSRKAPISSKLENMLVPEGKVVGLEGSDGQDGYVLVKVHGIHDPLRMRKSTLERVTHGFTAGDWVRLREEQNQHSPVGILHSIHRDGTVAVGFIGLETLWKGQHSELQMVKPYHVGQFVRLKANVFSPRFEWEQKRGTWATGKIIHIYPNGCLAVNFPGRFPFGKNHERFLADPAEVEVVSFSSCQGVLKKYHHLEDIHWAVRPLLVALGLFTAMKVGLLVGKKIAKPKMTSEKYQGSITATDDQLTDGNAGKSQHSFPLLWPK